MLATCRSGPESLPARSPGSSSTTALPSDPVFVTRVHFPGHGGRFAKGCSVPDPYDVLTIAAIADELSATIGNGRIQRIGLLDPRTIGAEIYAGGQRHHLIASANDRQPRLRLAPDMPSLDSALVTPFGLLLRKHIRGGIILGIDQPPLERLVRLSIAKRQVPLKTRRTPHGRMRPRSKLMNLMRLDELHESREGVALSHVALYVELMGRHSNLILVDDDGRIMESAKRVTPEMSRVRPVLPRLPYVPPPPPDRLDPRTITPASAAQLLESLAAGCRAGARARQLLSRHQSSHGPRDRVPSHGFERDPRRRCERGERGVASTQYIDVAGAVADNGLEPSDLSRARASRSGRGRRVLCRS